MRNKYIALDILDTLDENLFNEIIKQPFNIVCKNFETEKHEVRKLNLMFKKKGYFWREKESKWTYYINEKDLNNLVPNVENCNVELYQGLTDNYLDLIGYTDEQRLQSLSSTKNKLKDLLLKKDKATEEISEALFTESTNSIMLNKVIFDDLKKITPEKARELSKKVVSETSEIVKIASELLSDITNDYTIFTNIVKKSNGSTIKHMTRTFIMTLSYFNYYNELLEKGYVSKVRVNFNTVYKKTYCKLLPQFNIDDIKLEKVFMGGMSTIPEQERNAIGVGYLLHDLGKESDIEYFEGSGSYDKKRIEAHVTNGFNDLLKRTVYPPVVSAIAGLHHEYYGHSSGYGTLRDLIKRKYPTGNQPDYCISYSLHDVYNGKAMGFFPAKILEIVDIYDALTDPERKYRSPLKPNEAVDFMRENFINIETKVDPILFDMFELFLYSSGEIK